MRKKKSADKVRRNSARITRNTLVQKQHRVELENAVLREQVKNKKSQMQNSLSTLTAGLTQAGLGQDNITSFSPLLQSNIYAPLTINWTLLMYAYKSHGLVQTMVDVPVLDAFRGGLELTSEDLDGKDLKDLSDALIYDGDLQAIGQAAIWARLFGGSALIINVEDDSDKPLKMDKLGKRIEFYAATRWELGSSERIPESGKYQFYGKTVDASRVLTMVGKRAPFIIENQLAGWGMSELERTLEDINLYLRTRNAIYELLNEAKIDVYKFKGFVDQLITSAGTEITQRRVQSMNQIKNFTNALLLDSEDEYEQKQISFTGLAEMMKEARIGVSGALRMPLTKLFGIGATGMNAGQEDLENYNAMVESEVRTPLHPIIKQVIRIKVRKIFGEDLDIDFKFKPLRVLSASDEEAIATSKTTRYVLIHNSRIITSQELGDMLSKDNLIPIPIAAQDGLLEDFPAPDASDVGGEPEGVETTDTISKTKDPKKPKKVEESEEPAEGKPGETQEPGQPGSSQAKKKK